MSAPKPVERIPVVNRPSRLSEVRERRRQYLAGLITGGALIVLCLVLMVIAGGVS